MSSEQDKSQQTEEPTHKKLEDARKEGKAATSREVNHWFMILGATMVVAFLVPTMTGKIARTVMPFIERPHTMRVSQEGAAGSVAAVMVELAWVMLEPLALLFILALAAGVLQRGVMVSANSIKPDLEKISLIKGVKRLFSLRSVAELLKGVLKIVIVAAAGFLLIWPKMDQLNQVMTLPANELLEVIYALAVRLLIGVSVIMLFIAALDFFYQRFEFPKSMRMTRQDLKDEMKQTEGDPQIKARLKALRAERARRRMMAEVPDADVVIVNPTHVAVALKYEIEKMHAPRVVAKGADLVAHRIRQVAEENDVAVVENEPLARALYATVDLDEQIPIEHYKAVAEIIGYVWRLKGKMSQQRPRA